MAALNFGIKNYLAFFDGEKIKSEITRNERRVLSGTGAYGRRVMRNLIKKAPKKKRRDRSGLFPRYHTHPNTGIRFILFVYVATTRSVVIGPQRFTTSGRKGRMVKGKALETMSRIPVPQLLNAGGVATRTIRYRSGKVYKRQIRYRPHPYADYAMYPTIKKMQQLTDEFGLL